MVEKNKDHNLEIKILENNNNIKTNLEEKLILDKNDNLKEEENNSNSFPKLVHEETAFTENIEEECSIPSKNYKNDIKINNKNIQINLKQNNQNNISNNKNTEIILDKMEDEINKNDVTNTTIPMFRNSNLNRESFQKIVELNNNKTDKAINEKNNSKLKIALLIIEIFLAILLSISSIVILIIIYKDSIINQKLISLVIEPIVFCISFIGIIPYKGRGCKKIVLSLYLWEGLFLIPFSFYVKTAVEDEDLKDIFNITLYARIFILSSQIVNFLLSLLLGINI